jgi:type II secretory pathway component PulC
MPTVAGDKEVQKADINVQHKDRIFNDSAFDNISKLDLFRPSRSAPVISKVKKEEKPPLKDPPKLFGTVILGDNKTAILEDPDSKTTKVYRLDDSIAGYKISEILEDKIVLSRDGDKVEVRLRDDKGIKPPRRKPKARASARRDVKSLRKEDRRRSRPVPQRRRPKRVRPPGNDPRSAPQHPDE